MTSSENDWILLFGNELKDLLKDSANMFYCWGQPCFTTGGKLVLLQGATLFYYRGNIVLPQGKLVFLQGATLFYYRGQTYFTTGGNLALPQEANSFYYRGQPCFTTGDKLVLPQGANLFYHKGQTCFTTGGKLILPQGLTLQRWWWRGEGGKLHKPP